MSPPCPNTLASIGGLALGPGRTLKDQDVNGRSWLARLPAPAQDRRLQVLGQDRGVQIGEQSVRRFPVVACHQRPLVSPNLGRGLAAVGFPVAAGASGVVPGTPPPRRFGQPFRQPHGNTAGQRGAGGEWHAARGDGPGVVAGGDGGSGRLRGGRCSLPGQRDQGRPRCSRPALRQRRRPALPGWNAPVPVARPRLPAWPVRPSSPTPAIVHLTNLPMRLASGRSPGATALRRV